MSKGRTTTEVNVPSFQQQQFQDIYNQAVGLANQPFIPFTGPQVAGFSPDELRAFDAQRSMFQSGQQIDPIQDRQNLISASQSAPGLLDVNIGSYQNPFTQNVIDQSIADINRQAQLARTSAQDRAIRAGAFGGSRSAILESESQRPFVDQIARTSANLRQAGFEEARRQAEADLARQQRDRAFQANLISQQESARNQALSGLLGTGAQQRQLQQAALTAARGEFDRALAFPGQQFGLLSQAVFGQPSLAGQTTRQRVGSGDILSGLTGLLGAAYSGGFNPLGFLTGGGGG